MLVGEGEEIEVEAWGKQKRQMLDRPKGVLDLWERSSAEQCGLNEGPQDT